MNMEDKQTIEQEKATEQIEQNVHCEQCDDYLAGWKRAQADYANLRKDTEREKAEFAKFANERLLSSLLPAIDQYEMALDFTPDLTDTSQEGQKKLINWIAGLKAVRIGWESAFKDIGLEQVSTDGTFDPLMHEAVGEEEADGKSSGEIVRCMQSGWRLNGKLLRPAKVILAK